MNLFNAARILKEKAKEKAVKENQNNPVETPIIHAALPSGLGTVSRTPGKSKTKSSLSSTARLVKSLIPSYLADTVRDSTKKSYKSYWSRYKSFCQVSNIGLSSAESISMFLISLAEQTKGNSASLIAKNAIKYHLKLLFPFKKCPSDSWFVSSILKSAKKKFGKPVKKAKTLDSEIIFLLVSNWLKSGEFKDERSAVFILCQFLLFARYEEIAHLKKSSVRKLASGDLEIEFSQAKNFNSWDAKTSLIAKNTSGFDPVEIIMSYIEKLPSSSPQSQWLFPNFRSGKGKSIVFLEKPVSYDNMMKLFRQGLDSLGLDGKSFSLHSVRTGAVSEAVNSGTCDRETIKRHVRWASVEMVDHYHKFSLENKLKPCRALSIYNH